ncbi:hypothetical protein NE237_000937 [Protea cynaroides]|uniref:Uncharacterized protein n=1 Tax=Protea cynaroides TaxID=273540 RepID=A0A9Q0KT80_9MAGN|nr:hypothetical protein NE237_000937 [Protea cynaroides]
MSWFGTVLLTCSQMQFKLSEVYGSVRIDRMRMSCTLAHVLTSTLLFLALGKMKVGSITSTLLSTYLVLSFIVYVDFMLIGHVLDGMEDCLGMELGHFYRLVSALAKGKTKVIELLRESRPEYYIDSIQKSIKKKKKKRKKLFGSIGTQYSWCSLHVRPMPMAI